MKKIKVTKETSTGLNTTFNDPNKKGTMSRSEFVKKIQRGQYPDYHIREMDGRKIPCSNPDRSKKNNLG